MKLLEAQKPFDREAVLEAVTAVHNVVTTWQQLSSVPKDKNRRELGRSKNDPEYFFQLDQHCQLILKSGIFNASECAEWDSKRKQFLSFHANPLFKMVTQTDTADKFVETLIKRVSQIVEDDIKATGSSMFTEKPLEEPITTQTLKNVLDTIPSSDAKEYKVREWLASALGGVSVTARCFPEEMCNDFHRRSVALEDKLDRGLQKEYIPEVTGLVTDTIEAWEGLRKQSREKADDVFWQNIQRCSQGDPVACRIIESL